MPYMGFLYPEQESSENLSSSKLEKESYIKDKADELGITEEEYIESLIEREYLTDNPELPNVSVEEELTEQAISLIYSIRDDKIKLLKAVKELEEIKSPSIIGEIRK